MIKKIIASKHVIQDNTKYVNDLLLFFLSSAILFVIATIVRIKRKEYPSVLLVFVIFKSI